VTLRWWPRSIRLQLVAGIVLLEALSIILFATVLVREQTRQVYQRAQHRLAHQATSVALQAREALLQQRPGWVGLSVRMMGEAPSVGLAKVTDPAGNVLFASQGEPDQLSLDPAELAQIPLAKLDEPRVFTFGKQRWEGMKPIYAAGVLRGFAWVETDRAWDHEQLNAFLDSTITFGIIWIAASALLVLLMSTSISRPLAVLHKGTQEPDAVSGIEQRFSAAGDGAERNRRP